MDERKENYCAILVVNRKQKPQLPLWPKNQMRQAQLATGDNVKQVLLG